MEITLNRKYKKSNYTIGEILINNKFVCSTIEDKDYGFDKSTPVETIKQTKATHPAQVAIPHGRYEISTSYYRGMSTKYPWYKSTSCKGNIPCLVNVPGYTGILIHCGTDASSSAGCIIVGFNTKKGQLTDSRKAFMLVCDAIMDAKSKGEKVYITIK